MFVASRSGGSWAYASPGFEGALAPDVLDVLRAAAVDGSGDGETTIMDGRGKVVDTTRGGAGASAPAATPPNDGDDDDLDDGETLPELEEAAALQPAPVAPPDAAWLLGRGGGGE